MTKGASIQCGLLTGGKASARYLVASIETGRAFFRQDGVSLLTKITRILSPMISPTPVKDQRCDA